MKKRQRGGERHGKLEPGRKIAQKKEKSTIHALEGRGAESDRAAVVATVVWQHALSPQNVRDGCDVCSLPVLSTLLRRGRAISRVKCALRRGLRVPQVALRPPLSLLSLSCSASLCLRPGALRESACASTVEPARLRGGASTALRASRTASAHTTDVFSAGSLGIRFKCSLW